jgi:hypothetical protein
MATALAYALKSKFDNVEMFGDVDTGAPAADGSPAQPVPPEHKDEQAKKVGKLALFDFLMGILVAFVAWGYNSEEKNLVWKIATVVFAFMFWHIYGLYFLIRAGALGKAKAMGSLVELVAVPKEFAGQVKNGVDQLKKNIEQMKTGNLGLNSPFAGVKVTASTRGDV